MSELADCNNLALDIETAIVFSKLLKQLCSYLEHSLHSFNMFAQVMFELCLSADKTE
jgi:hypothetical protein